MLDNKQEEIGILDKVGKDSGFRVPDNFFENFATQMEQNLPPKEFKPEAKPTLWVRIHPYIYMAAMFTGIFCAMKVFTTLSENSDAFTPSTAEAFDNENFIDNFVLTSDCDEYLLMSDAFDELEDSVNEENVND